ncbi:hypothetical protein PanWU01x14_167010, partial [Parasponia andersonii]
TTLFLTQALGSDKPNASFDNSLSTPANAKVLVNEEDKNHTTDSIKPIINSDIPDQSVPISTPAKTKKSQVGGAKLKSSSSPKPTLKKKKASAKEKRKAKVQTPRTIAPSSPEIKTLLKKAYNFAFYIENL